MKELEQLQLKGKVSTVFARMRGGNVAGLKTSGGQRALSPRKSVPVGKGQQVARLAQTTGMAQQQTHQVVVSRRMGRMSGKRDIDVFVVYKKTYGIHRRASLSGGQA